MLCPITADAWSLRYPGLGRVDGALGVGGVSDLDALTKAEVVIPRCQFRGRKAFAEFDHADVARDAQNIPDGEFGVVRGHVAKGLAAHPHGSKATSKDLVGLQPPACSSAATTNGFITDRVRPSR
jgi:hypothetical protein